MVLNHSKAFSCCSLVSKKFCERVPSDLLWRSQRAALIVNTTSPGLKVQTLHATAPKISQADLNVQ